jgi:hypothetical protein
MPRRAERTMVRTRKKGRETSRTLKPEEEQGLMAMKTPPR